MVLCTAPPATFGQRKASWEQTVSRSTSWEPPQGNSRLPSPCSDRRLLHPTLSGQRLRRGFKGWGPKGGESPHPDPSFTLSQLNSAIAFTPSTRATTFSCVTIRFPASDLSNTLSTTNICGMD